MAHTHFHGAASCSGFHLFPDATFLSLCGKGDFLFSFTLVTWNPSRSGYTCTHASACCKIAQGSHLKCSAIFTNFPFTCWYSWAALLNKIIYWNFQKLFPNDTYDWRPTLGVLGCGALKFWCFQKLYENSFSCCLVRAGRFLVLFISVQTGSRMSNSISWPTQELCCCRCWQNSLFGFKWMLVHGVHLFCKYPLCLMFSGENCLIFFLSGSSLLALWIFELQGCFILVSIRPPEVLIYFWIFFCDHVPNRKKAL